MKILGIESSCDETSVAIVEDGRKVLSNIIATSLDFHKQYGGIIPEIACRHHTEIINYVLQDALKKAGLGLNDIDVIAVTQGPGLVGALLVGISLAKALSFSLDKPLVGVNHIQAHLYSSMMSVEELEFPSVGLVVSGGHTNLYYVDSPTDIKLIGYTRDDACGEAFDKVAKILELGFPGGPVIEKLASNGDPKKIKFPRSFLEKGSFDFSFSGIKTAVLYYVRDIKSKGEQVPVNDICAGFQEAVFEMLLTKAEAACIEKKAKSIFCGGGVIANKTLRNKIDLMAQKLALKSCFPGVGMSMDNAAMIAGLAFHLYNKGVTSELSLSPQPRMVV
ncbi:MAG: tRNA (adenosine(37)-N6)-threonylcarbamoyltransferase complex transferase subunit TsaD [Candidatus Omnitrophota bacterium]